MAYYMKMKYPCGFEYEVRCGGLFIFGFTHKSGLEDGCPLHGKKCPSKIKKKVKDND